MGTKVGRSVGDNVGTKVGELVTEDTGVNTGAEEGHAVNTIVGDAVHGGQSEGRALLLLVGKLLGAKLPLHTKNIPTVSETTKRALTMSVKSKYKYAKANSIMTHQ